MSHPRTTTRSLTARFLSQGLLERLPKRPDDREELLDLVAWRVLPEGSETDEPGLNLGLRAFTEDTAMLRRALVDHGRVERSADGSRYRGVVPVPPLVIREAEAGDDAEVNRITVAAYSEHFEDPTQGYLHFVSTAAAARRTEALTWVAERGGVVLGAVTLTWFGNEWADVARPGELEFRLLCIDPALQRGGVGRALVEAIVEEGRRREGTERIVLTTNDDWTAANAFYRSLGFERRPQRDWSPADAEGVQLVVYAQPV